MSKTSKHYETILALDPSGSYKEGKGTTGWCILNDNNQILEQGAISATDYSTCQLYWKEHERLIKRFKKQYPNGVVVFEDYLLYANKAKQQINSRMETPQLLGILKYIMDIEHIPYVIQGAYEVKRRWSESILVWKGILVQRNRHYYICNVNNTYALVNQHTRDAIKHAVHFNTFKNKEK